MPGVEFLQTLLQRAEVRGSRSTVLAPLGGLLSLLVAALLICPLVRADRWVSILFAAATAVSFVAFVSAYAWFAVKSPDSLRSERYSLMKLSIEKSVTGDNRTGFAEPQGSPPVLPAADVVGDRKTPETRR